GARAVVDRLGQVGFLCLLPPWPAHTGHLENEILRVLEPLPADAGLAPWVAVWRPLVDLQAGFPADSAPARSARDMERLVEDLRLSAETPARPAPDQRRHRRSGRH